MDRNLISYTVIATVAIILTAVLVAPMASVLATTTKHDTNDGDGVIFRADRLDATEYSATFANSSGNWTWTDAAGTYSGTVSANVTIMTWSGGFIRFGPVGNAYVFFETDGAVSYSSTADPITISVADGMITFGGGITSTSPYTWLMYPSASGEYVMYNTSLGGPGILDKNSQIYGAGITNTSTVQTIITIAGTISDYTVTALHFDNVTPTITDVRTTSEDVGISGVSFTNIQFNINIGDTATAATYNQIYLPYEVSYTVDSGYGAVAAAIPAILIIALIVGFVAIIRGRDD